MLLWPLQSTTSPNKTEDSVARTAGAALALALPVLALPALLAASKTATVYGPPAATGCRSATKAPPVTLASTVKKGAAHVATPPGQTATCSAAVPLTVPQMRALAGARCSTMSSPSTLLKVTTAAFADDHPRTRRSDRLIFIFSLRCTACICRVC